MASATSRADWRTPTVVLVATGLILMLSMGIRHGFGLFLQPLTSDHGWGRETFALAIAVQNLMWGLATPFAGMFADRFGSHRVAFVCGLLYVAGLATMAYATSPLTFVLTAGVLIGAGLAGVTFSVVAGVLGRKYPPEKRSMAPVEAILPLVSPMVPHIAEELWQALGLTTLILDVPWPQPQAEALEVSALTVVIQVNGKVRSKLLVPATATDEDIKNWALNDPAIEKWLKGQPPKKVILARRKLVDIVV